MSPLHGRTVRIIVYEPYEWHYGNLVGKVTDMWDNTKMTVRLSKIIMGEKITSDILELRPRYSGETFEPLGDYNSVMINGALIKESPGEFDFILSGTVSIE